MTPNSPSSFVLNAKPTHFDPNQPLSAGQWISTQGIGLISAPMPGRSYTHTVPELPWDHLVLHLRYPSKLQGKLVHKYDAVTKPGDIFIVPRGVASDWQNADPCDVLLLVLVPSLLTDIALATFDLDPARVQLKEQIATPDPLVQAIGQALLHAEQAPGLGEQLYIESLLNTLVLHLFRHHLTHPQQPPACKGGLVGSTLRHIHDYIRANLAHELSLATLAQEANLSIYHFAHLFRRTNGRIRASICDSPTCRGGETASLAGDGNVARGCSAHWLCRSGRHCKELLGVTPKMLIKERKNLPNLRKNRRDDTK